MEKWTSKSFYGVPISECEKKQGYINLETVSKAFDCVRCNDITNATKYYNWELYSGAEEDDGGNYREIFQYFIISEQGADILKEFTSYPIYYIYDLDLFIWGVTHFGNPWSNIDLIPLVVDEV